MAATKRFLTSKDVAWILDCGPDDVIELVRRGKLQERKQGRFWRYRAEDVAAYKRKRSLEEAS